MRHALNLQMQHRWNIIYTMMLYTSQVWKLWQDSPTLIYESTYLLLLTTDFCICYQHTNFACSKAHAWSSLAWCQFSCPARALNCQASSAFNSFSLDIFLSLQIWIPFYSSIYICWSKETQFCLCSVCKPRYLRFSNSSWLVFKVFFSTLMILSSKFFVRPQKKLLTWQQIKLWS